jgi:hypothetical protein
MRAHEVLVEVLNEALPRLSPAAYGVAGRSAAEAASVHLGAQYVAKLDIKNYFPSIRPRHVRKALITEFAEDEPRLIRLVMSKDHLPQGAFAAPAVGNLVLAALDREILEVAGENIRYTRYQDDFLISGDDRGLVQATASFIRSRLRRMGFRSTLKLMDSQRESVEILGFVINSGELSAPRRKRDRVKAAIHRLEIGSDPIDSVESILGRIEDIKGTNPSTGNALLRRLDRALRVRLLKQLAR